MDLLQKLYLQYLLTWKKCNFKEFVLIHLLPKEKKKKRSSSEFIHLPTCKNQKK